MTGTTNQEAFNRLHHAITGLSRSEKRGTRTNTVAIPADPLHENVYRLIPEVYVAPPKEQRYRSQFADQARKEYKEDVKKAASMGPLKVPLPPKAEFLKKGHGVAKPQVPKSQRDRSVLKAAVPGPHDAPKIPPCTKNFIKQNALDNINSLPKKLGNEKASPLAKKDYGKTPEYLKQRITEMKQADLDLANRLAQQEQDKHTAQLEQQGIVVLPEGERERILRGLRDNWEKLNLDYQKLSLTVDTVPKIARKVNLEQQLKQYEELIDKFSHTTIH
ncbi:hypothetical protein HDU91_006447, partial [Kappamyces sp. JEL0680]